MTAALLSRFSAIASFTRRIPTIFFIPGSLVLAALLTAVALAPWLIEQATRAQADFERDGRGWRGGLAVMRGFENAPGHVMFFERDETGEFVSVNIAAKQPFPGETTRSAPHVSLGAQASQDMSGRTVRIELFGGQGPFSLDRPAWIGLANERVVNWTRIYVGADEWPLTVNLNAPIAAPGEALDLLIWSDQDGRGRNLELREILITPVLGGRAGAP